MKRRYNMKVVNCDPTDDLQRHRTKLHARARGRGIHVDATACAVARARARVRARGTRAHSFGFNDFHPMADPRVLPWNSF